MLKSSNITEGNVTKSILSLFFPMLLTNALQQIYSVADTAIVGKGIGDNALAAVGNTTTVCLFIIGFLQGLSNGFSVVIAQKYGSGDIEKLKKSIADSIKICTIVSISLTIISFLFLHTVFKLMNTDEMIMNDSLIYGYIVFGGLIITATYNLFSAILRAMGDSKTPLIAIIVSSVANILLDIILIFIFHIGVGGAAIATVFAQLISVFICFIRLKRNNCISFNRNYHISDRETSNALMKNGLSMAFMNSITAIGCIIVQSFINELGAESTSAYSVCTRYLNMFMLPSITAGFTLSAFVGQNYGAKKYDRISSGMKIGLIIAVVSHLIFGSMMLLFPNELSHFMLNGDKAVLYANTYMRVLAFSLITLNCIFIFRSTVQGLGKPVIPMFSGIAEMILRIIAIVVLLPKINFIATAYADIVAWIIALSMNVAAYFFYMKKIMRKERDQY